MIIELRLSGSDAQAVYDALRYCTDEDYSAPFVSAPDQGYPGAEEMENVVHLLEDLGVRGVVYPNDLRSTWDDE